MMGPRPRRRKRFVESLHQVFSGVPAYAATTTVKR